jgi:hypothetical protein
MYKDRGITPRVNADALVKVSSLGHGHKTVESVIFNGSIS